MLLGEVIYTNTDPVYTPPIKRVSDKAAFTIEVLQVAGTSPSLAIDIEHKNFDESAWASAGIFTALTAVGVGAKTVSGLKEQLRLKFTMSGTNAWERIFVYEPNFQ